MVAIQIASDLHLEFRGENFKKLIKPSAPILFLLGDISACGMPIPWETYKNFIRYISPKYKYIFHVPGNHEYYTTNKNITPADTISGIDNKIKNFAKTTSNLYFLNNNVVRLSIDNKKYVFVGTTLWTNVRKNDYKFIQSNMNDYCNIHVNNELDNSKGAKLTRKFNVCDMNKLHIKSVNYVLNIIKKNKSDENIILLTHHKPIRTIDIEKNRISQAYETDLSDIIIKTPVKLACYGHTHVKFDKIINGVRCFSNPKGYPNQRTDFNISGIVEV
jgi:predicted MPP superfamily phosphohydrolase